MARQEKVARKSGRKKNQKSREVYDISDVVEASLPEPFPSDECRVPEETSMPQSSVCEHNSEANDKVTDAEEQFKKLEAMINSPSIGNEEKLKAIEEFTNMSIKSPSQIGFLSCIADGLGMIKDYLKSKNNFFAAALLNIFFFFFAKATAIRMHAEHEGYTLGDFKKMFHSEDLPTVPYSIIFGIVSFAYLVCSLLSGLIINPNAPSFYDVQCFFLLYLIPQLTSLVYELGRYKKLYGGKK